MPDVVDNPAQSRLEIVEDAGISVLEYRKINTQLAIIHTGVPKQFEGRGYAGQLVQAAIDMARAEGLSVVPYCPYAKSWIEKHPEAVEGLTIDPIHS
jgi:predicted GNAT family acetyltransferase